MIEAEQVTAEGEERLMDVGPPVVADRQAPLLIQPSQRPLDHPAMATQALA
ncbi:MAG: hypothetical protein AVDCRST_MAG43-773 [uncultured Thermomicrobiales bacterium]|uniref:Uncharacterized protein n=1 Tax=uncultured Thermomicrobiales bacterium TaxID=1645740 RepID=A0A6J4UDD4_9BACT|nr:MAG: hypothetical protein AVDCRST_MAG43-773 [uncultured Thermomicrobiales bacterium]